MKINGMKINGLVETAVHVEDVPRSAEFNERLFDLRAFYLP
jgi:hypothetical protein